MNVLDDLTGSNSLVETGNDDLFDYMRFRHFLEQFKNEYPYFSDQIVDCYPSGQMEITIKMNDGTKMAYNALSKSVRTIYDPYSENGSRDEVDDEQWLVEFSTRFNDKLMANGMSQRELSMMTGISVISINRYSKGKAVPNARNIVKIARSLKCSVSELVDF